MKNFILSALAICMFLNNNAFAHAVKCEALFTSADQSPGNGRFIDLIKPNVGRKLISEMDQAAKAKLVNEVVTPEDRGLYRQLDLANISLTDLAKVTYELIENLENFTLEQRRFIRNIAKGGVPKETKTDWGVMTTPKDLVLGLYHWATQPEQVQMRAFNLRLKKMSQMATTFDQAELQKFRSYFEAHGNIDGLQIGVDFIDRTLAMNGYFRESHFSYLMGSHHPMFSIDPMLMQNSSFRARLKQHLLEPNAKSEAIAEEVLRFITNNLQISKNNPAIKEIFNLIKERFPRTRALLVHHERGQSLFVTVGSVELSLEKGVTYTDN